MTGIIFFIVALFLVGFILLTGKPAHKKMTREEFLQELTQFLEGTLEPIDDGVYENAFRINFQHNGEQFIYEDMEKPSFKEKIYFARLKIKTNSKLTLTFAEKQRSLKIRSDIFISSNISSQQAGKGAELKVSPKLRDMDIFTNDAILANRFLADGKISSIYKRFKNTDARGYSFIPIEIVDGMISLAFSADAAFTPNLASLRADMPSIEDYCNKLILIVKKLKEL